MGISPTDEAATGRSPRAAADWYASLPPPAGISWLPGGASLRRYADTPQEIVQPALDQDIVCLHLGGPKQVRRWSGGRASDHEVESGSLTLMPAGAANRWRTRGPIDYAHLALDPALLRQVALEEFGREPAQVELGGAVGFRDALLEQLFLRLLATQGSGRPGGRLHTESLLVVMAAHLVDGHCVARCERARAPAVERKGGLGPPRMRRVLEYMDAGLGGEIALATLAAASGFSRAHFFRAFKQSTGMSPSRYVDQRRLERAAEMLAHTALDLEEIAVEVGLGGRLVRLFQRRYGVSPALYRLSRR